MNKRSISKGHTESLRISESPIVTVVKWKMNDPCLDRDERMMLEPRRRASTGSGALSPSSTRTLVQAAHKVGL